MNIPERYTKEDATEEDRQLHEQLKVICNNFTVATKGLYLVIERKENGIE